MQAVTHADIQQRIPELLEATLYHSPSEDRWSLKRRGMFAEPIRWLCSVAGQQAMGAAAVAAAVEDVFIDRHH
jgi:hypothetical protein